MSQVYFARAAKTGFIKIGYSKDAVKRAGDLQVGNAEDLSIIHTVDGGRAEEHGFHLRFSDSHERGEWFREDGKLYTFLKAKNLHWDRFNGQCDLLLEQTVKRGFCRNKDELELLYKTGLPDKSIYMVGRGSENLPACLATFRGRPGKIIVASNLRVFGKNKREIMAAMHGIEETNIQVIDITHPEDSTHSKLIERGVKAVSNNRYLDHRRAKREGRMGGLGKGIAAKGDREGIVPAFMLERIAQHPDIPWRVKQDLVRGVCGASTLHRRYKLKT